MAKREFWKPKPTGSTSRGGRDEAAVGLGAVRRLVPIGAAIVMFLAGCGTSTHGSSSSTCSVARGSSSHAAGPPYNLPSRVQRLEINNAAGCIQVTGTSGSSHIQVVERPTGKASPSRHVSGSTATLGSLCPAGINVSDCHMDYQVTMPSSIALNVRGDAGHVILKGGLAEAQIQTSVGEVTGTGLSGGSYTVTADDGNVTNFGEVDLTFTSAPRLVKVTTDQADVTVTVPGKASYRATASSQNGSGLARVANDASAPNVIDLRSVEGDVSIYCTRAPVTSPSTRASHKATCLGLLQTLLQPLIDLLP